MKTRVLVFSLFIVLCFTCATAFGLSGLDEQTSGQGDVNWENGIITVEGIGVPSPDDDELVAPVMALRAAKVDAYRNALETISSVRISSSSTVNRARTTSDAVSAKALDGFIKGFQFEKPIYDSKGRCTITMHIPVGGHNGLTSLVLDQMKQNPSSAPVAPVAPDVVPDAAADNTNVPAEYTGLIIDARNFGVKGALCPQVFDADGYLVYGANMADINDPGFSTIVAYSKSLENAKTLPRIGNNPMIIKATGAVKANGESTDVIISSVDSKAFRQSKTKNEIIAKAAVVLIIN